MAITIAQLAKFQKEDLTKEGIFEEIRGLVYNPQYFYEMINAILIRHQLNRLLSPTKEESGLSDELYNKYQELRIYLDFAVLPDLNEEELKNLFKNHFFFAVRREIDLENRFDLAFLADGIDYITWEGRRTAILRGMKESEENLNFKEAGGEIFKVKDWLNEYDSFKTDQAERDELDRVSFLQSPAAKRFSKCPREYLIKVLEAYDLVKYGLRWDKKATGIILPGKKGKEYHYIPVGHYLSFEGPGGKPSKPAAVPQPEERVISTAAQITQAYQSPPQESQKIQALENKYPARASLVELSQSLHQALFKKDKIQLVAVLRVLAKTGQLNKLLTEDKKTINDFRDYLESLQKPDLLEGFKITPDREDFMSLFLRYVLEKRMGLTENEAARIGMQLGNLLRQGGVGKYMKMAYFDSAGGEFRWK